MSRTNPTKTELIWTENLLFAVVCAPKGFPKEEILKFAQTHYSGTSINWELLEEKSPKQCPDFNEREHWFFEC